MPVVLIHEQPGLTREQYQEGMHILNTPSPPSGARLHLSGPMEGGWVIVEVWESEEEANAFYSSEAFHQMLQKIGATPPKTTSYPVEGTWQRQDD